MTAKEIVEKLVENEAKQIQQDFFEYVEKNKHFALKLLFDAFFSGELTRSPDDRLFNNQSPPSIQEIDLSNIFSIITNNAALTNMVIKIKQVENRNGSRYAKYHMKTFRAHNIPRSLNSFYAIFAPPDENDLIQIIEIIFKVKRRQYRITIYENEISYVYIPAGRK